MKAWPILGISVVQLILLLAHWFIYTTWIDFWPPMSPATVVVLRWTVLALGLSFVSAAMLGFRFDNAAVRFYYKVAAIWLGFLNFFFWAAWLCRLIDLGYRLARVPAPRPAMIAILFGLAALVAVYGLINARWIRLRRVPVTLANLPACWKGRTALLLTDIHLGNINGPRFTRRLVRLAGQLQPDIVFIPGDLFDGTHADPDRLVAPFKDLSPRFGTWFATGNHEEFGDVSHYLAALTRAGVRVMANQSATLDGLTVVGVDYPDSMNPLHLRSLLEKLRPTDGGPSILLSHVPSRLPVVEQAGISLQLSGHTHGGQVIPFTWFTRRVFGRFTYGLNSFGSLQVYTSTGAGTWGPPMRVGTDPEAVLLTFE